MDGLGARAGGRSEQLVDDQIGLRRGATAERERLVGIERVGASRSTSE